ncbi:MAG: acoC [Proteobacteria bacterium]|nr:acoC [Pseudomonadota bacterium]
MSSQSPATFEVRLHHSGGTGAPLLLIHGFGADRRTFTANQPSLSAVADVWSLDLPGHGASPWAEGAKPSATAFADAISRALDAEEVGRVDIVGHSLGGAVSGVFAARYPERIRSLTALAASGLGRPVPRVFVETLPTLTDVEATEHLLQRLFVRKSLANRRLALYMLDELEKPGRRAALSRIASEMTAISAEADAAFHAVAEAGLPRLVVWGAGDAVNPLDEERLEAVGGERFVIPDVGHLPHVEAAVSVNRRLAAFLAELAA